MCKKKFKMFFKKSKNLKFILKILILVILTKLFLNNIGLLALFPKIPHFTLYLRYYLNCDMFYASAKRTIMQVSLIQGQTQNRRKIWYIQKMRHLPQCQKTTS